MIPPHASRSFDQLANFLREELLRRKASLLKGCCPKAQARPLVRALSPQNSFGSMKSLLGKEPRGHELFARGEKKHFVPKFIQQNIKRKGTLLESLLHRRTMTIEESQILVNAHAQSSKSQHR